MKIIAAIAADFDRTVFDRPARLNDELRGETVLRRTLRRLSASERLSGVYLAVNHAQEHSARAAAEGLNVQVETHDGDRPPWHAYLAAARKWSLDGWRGGLCGANVYDEWFHPWIFEVLARREQADAVMAIPAAAPLLDPGLLDEVIDHFSRYGGGVRMALTQSSPGLSAAVYEISLLSELSKIGHPPGRAMAYHPRDVRHDIANQTGFLNTDAIIMQGLGRCIVDTQTAAQRVSAILEDIPNPDALNVSRWLLEHRWQHFGVLPHEVEIELTTADPLENSTLRPRGSAVGRRGPMDFALFARLIEELAGRDDIRVVFGGFGDPLLHPEFTRCLECCHQAGLFGLAVRTPAVHLDKTSGDALFACEIDVLNVLIDATTASTYRQIHAADHFDRVQSNIHGFLETQCNQQKPVPLTVCELLKTADNLDEMEEFYDYWTLKTGAAVLGGPSHYAGQWPNRAVMDMAPPARTPCTRLFNRLMVLADGRVTACDQDFQGRYTVGSLADQSLQAIWTGPPMTAIRQGHLVGRFDAMPLCPACSEWHRP
ncbi:MAG: NTP transferase domain-containing protein [Phycisphaerales bacterium]|nr:NTP transferase domain-containing protein [Phycisphaerales bacterium]